MRLARILNRPGRLGRLWRSAYEVGYAVLTTLVLLLFRPLFQIGRVGPEPHWPRGGFILCGNHTSYLDPAFVQLVVPRRVTFVMTNDFYTLPAGRWFFALVGAVPMASGRLGHRGLLRAAALVRRGHVVGLFPEGRLSRDGSPGEPQRGIAALARRTGAPVLPLGIEGAFRVWPRGARWFRRGPVRILFGSELRYGAPPAGPRELRDADRAFAGAVMRQIRGLWARLGGTAPAAASIPEVHVHADELDV